MIDPLALNIDVNEVETGRPTIADNTEATLECVAAEVAENKARNGFNLVLTWKTVEELPNSKGDGTMVPAGFTLKRWLALQPSDKVLAKVEELKAEGKTSEANKSLNRFKEDIASTLDAMFNTNKGSRPNLSQDVIAQMPSKTVRAVIKLRDDDQFGPSNELGYYKTT